DRHDRAQRGQEPAHEDRRRAPATVEGSDLVELSFVEEPATDSAPEEPYAVAARQPVGKRRGGDVAQERGAEDEPQVRMTGCGEERAEEDERVGWNGRHDVLDRRAEPDG